MKKLSFGALKYLGIIDSILSLIMEFLIPYYRVRMHFVKNKNDRSFLSFNSSKFLPEIETQLKVLFILSSALIKAGFVSEEQII